MKISAGHSLRSEVRIALGPICAHSCLWYFRRVVESFEMLRVECLEVALLVGKMWVVFLIALGEVSIEGVFLPLLAQHLPDIEV